jgi:hypothetical protein
MGWLKKKFRQLDRRVRKIFGKNAWLKVAALIGGVYIGMSGAGGGSASLGSSGTWAAGTKGMAGTKFGQFFSNIGSGIKSMFWNPKKPGTWKTPPGGGTQVYVPGTKAGLSWAGQAAAQTGLSVAAGYGQAKLMEGDPVGQYVAAGSNEPSTLAVVQNAYNTQAGQSVNILQAYDNLYYGTASTQVADNFLSRGRRIGVS